MNWTDIVKQAREMATTEEEKTLAQNLPLVKHICDRLGTRSEDDRQVGIMALCQSVKRWKPARGIFSTFACRCISNAIKNYQLRDRRVKRGGRCEWEEFRPGQWADPRQELDPLEAQWADTLWDYMRPEDRICVKAHFDGFTYREMSSQMGVTRQRCQQRVERAIKDLRRKLRKAGNL